MSSPPSFADMLRGEPATLIVETEAELMSRASGSGAADSKPSTSSALLFDDDDDEHDDDEAEPSATAAHRKHHFLKELRVMMYAFGGDREPYQETLELLEQMTVEYIEAMTMKCVQTGKAGKIGLEDIWYLTRRDHRKFARVKDLLNMSEELKKARKAFDENKFGGTTK